MKRAELPLLFVGAVLLLAAAAYALLFFTARAERAETAVCTAERWQDTLALPGAVTRAETPVPVPAGAVRPLALARAGDYHGGDDPAEPSATAVRAAISRGEPIAELVPPEAAACFSGAAAHDLRFGERAMLARLRAMGSAEWEAVPFGSEGLWSKVMKNARSAQSVEEIISRSLSRRYARTRLQRLLLCAYLGIDEKTLFLPAPYVRALAFDDLGRAVLRRARERGRLNIINAGDAPPDAAYGELERRAADLYGLFSEAAPECGTAAGIRVYVL